MIQLTQKLQSIDRLSQGTSLQVIQKENEWKDKVIQLEKDFKAREEALRKEVDQAQTDKQLISIGFEDDSFISYLLDVRENGFVVEAVPIFRGVGHKNFINCIRL